MEAGRKLDLLVAEKVLGFHLERITPQWYGREVSLFFRPGDPLVAYSYDDNGCNAVMYRNGSDERDGIAPPLPFYSTDMAAASEVMQTMLTSSLAYIFGSRLGDDYDEHAHARGAFLAMVLSNMTPERICRAALAAVEWAASVGVQWEAGTPAMWQGGPDTNA